MSRRKAKAHLLRWDRFMVKCEKIDKDAVALPGYSRAYNRYASKTNKLNRLRNLRD